VLRESNKRVLDLAGKWADDIGYPPKIDSRRDHTQKTEEKDNWGRKEKKERRR